MLPILRGRWALISPNATPLFMPAYALTMQLRSGGYVIYDPRNRLLERSKHSAEHRIALEI
jgi:hypothetical protein